MRLGWCNSRLFGRCTNTHIHLFFNLNRPSFANNSKLRHKHKHTQLCSCVCVRPEKMFIIPNCFPQIYTYKGIHRHTNTNSAAPNAAQYFAQIKITFSSESSSLYLCALYKQRHQNQLRQSKHKLMWKYKTKMERRIKNI